MLLSTVSYRKYLFKFERCIYNTLTKLHKDELPSVKAADLVSDVVLESVYTYELTGFIVPFNHWPLVKCGLGFAKLRRTLCKK